MPCIYILYSDLANHTYVGSSRKDSADSRLKEHNLGKTRSTKSGIPWRVIYQEEFFDYTSARKREIFLKSGVGRKWIKQEVSFQKM